MELHGTTWNYMELLGCWHLIHRSHDRLKQLAIDAGALPDRISIGVEPEGVNLFLHVKNGHRD